MGCHALLQGICPTQGWNPGRLQCRQILYLPSHQGRPPKDPSRVAIYFGNHGDVWLVSSFKKENLLRGTWSAGSLLLQPLWGTLSFPNTVMLLGSWAFLASTGPLLGHSMPSFINLPTSPSFTSEPSLMVWKLFLPSAHTSHYLSEAGF